MFCVGVDGFELWTVFVESSISGVSLDSEHTPESGYKNKHYFEDFSKITLKFQLRS